MRIAPSTIAKATPPKTELAKASTAESVVPGDYPQVQQDIRSFPEPVLNLMDQYGIKVAVLDEGETLAESPALRHLAEGEYEDQRLQARELTFNELKNSQATNLTDFAEATTRVLRKAGLEFHFGLSDGEPTAQEIAHRQGISEADFPHWNHCFEELNEDFPPGLFLLPHIYDDGKPIPENQIRSAREVSAEYVEKSLGLNRPEDRLVLLHKKFTAENAPEVGNYRLVLHEAGHALDHLLDRMTGFPGLGTLHRQTVDAMYEKDLNKAQEQGTEAVFTTKRASENVREYFAEAVEAYLTYPEDDAGEIFRTENSNPGLKAKNPTLHEYVGNIMSRDFSEAQIPKPPGRPLLPEGIPDPDLAVIYF